MPETKGNEDEEILDGDFDPVISDGIEVLDELDAGVSHCSNNGVTPL